jgi:formimidoylglutamate deiminase
LKEVASAADPKMPIHIHIAEQRGEVKDCLAEHGETPVDWLLSQVSVDQRWNLVHATQCTPEELDSIHKRRASIVLCPSTEANLGDGIFDLPSWLSQAGNWSIGSDSHVTRNWQDELRLLEYSQRLKLRQRNVAARSVMSDSTAGILFQGALRGGTAASGADLGGLAIGQRADFIVVDTDSPSLAGTPPDRLLDTMVFSSPPARFSHVFVAAREVLQSGVQAAAKRGMVDAMSELWS